MSTKQVIGATIIFIVLLCTLLAIGGIWGLVDGDTAWQLFWTLCVVAIGLGTAGHLGDVYFKDAPLIPEAFTKKGTDDESPK